MCGLNDYRDVYVAACGQVFANHYSGQQHERYCEACARARGDVLEDEREDED